MYLTITTEINLDVLNCLFQLLTSTKVGIANKAFLLSKCQIKTLTSQPGTQVHTQLKHATRTCK